MLIKDFQLIRPKYEASQETLLDWLSSAHEKAREKLGGAAPDFKKELREKLFKIGAGENKIEKRGFSMRDAFHLEWDEMEVFNLDSAPEGYHLDKRMAFFKEHSGEVFETFYKEDASLPPHLIHVTCTGYVAPSPAQKMVSKKANGQNTTVTHAYHMGCYGSIPAIRIAMGHYLVEKEESDIVHTELCTLHMNPTLHSTEQLVVQSLFADGFIKYRLGGEGPGLKILAVSEEVVDNTTSKMTWECMPWGFQMSLSKDIPVLIRRNLPGYLERLCKKASINPKALEAARYAIHPGGPKIIDQIGEQLHLDEEQMKHSKEVLKTCGNMSSATLPHIWEKMLKDVKSGQLVVSLAFGPGLNISGALFEVRK